MDKKVIYIYISCKPEKKKIYKEKLLDALQDQIVIVQTLEESNLVFSIGEQTEELRLELLKAAKLGLRIKTINYSHLSKSLKENILTGEKRMQHTSQRAKSWGKEWER